MDNAADVVRSAGALVLAELRNDNAAASSIVASHADPIALLDPVIVLAAHLAQQYGEALGEDPERLIERWLLQFGGQ